MIYDTSASLRRVGIELHEGGREGGRKERKEGRSQTKSLELEAAPLYLEEVSGEQRIESHFVLPSPRQSQLCLGAKPSMVDGRGERGRRGGNKRWGSSFGEEPRAA